MTDSLDAHRGSVRVGGAQLTTSAPWCCHSQRGESVYSCCRNWCRHKNLNSSPGWSPSLIEFAHSVPICCRSVTELCLTPWDPMDCSAPGFPVLHHLLELAQTHIHWAGNAIQTSSPQSSPPPAFNLPSVGVFSNESVLHIRWPKYWSFSFSISPSKEHSGLISFRMDWLDLLAVQGTLKSHLQHHGSKHHFFRAQLSLWSNSHIIHDYWKNHSFD